MLNVESLLLLQDIKNSAAEQSTKNNNIFVIFFIYILLLKILLVHINDDNFAVNRLKSCLCVYNYDLINYNMYISK